MRDEDAWFVVYTGNGQYKIKPRNRAGWLSFIAFMVVAIAPSLFIAIMRDPVPMFVVWLVIFPVALFFFWRFAKARARVIDLSAVEKDWDEFQAWKKRGRR